MATCATIFATKLPNIGRDWKVSVSLTRIDEPNKINRFGMKAHQSVHSQANCKTVYSSTCVGAGKFKLFSSLLDWFEFRLFRKDGKVVNEGDDLLAATRYGVTMLRFAKQIYRRSQPRLRQSFWGWGSNAWFGVSSANFFANQLLGIRQNRAASGGAAHCHFSFIFKHIGIYWDRLRRRL